MFSLINGKPVFYVGKINGIGYTNEKEKEQIIEQLKEDDSNIKVKDEKIEIDEELKEKAEKLAELKLTYSKSEFMQYLSGEKTHHLIKMKELEEKLAQAKQKDLMSSFAVIQLDSKILELEEKLNEFSK